MRSCGMHPELMHAWALGHAVSASPGAHGATQWLSTHFVPPRHCESQVHEPGLTLQAPRVKSQANPVGHGSLAEHRGAQRPSTQTGLPAGH